MWGQAMDVPEAYPYEYMLTPGSLHVEYTLTPGAEISIQSP